ASVVDASVVDASVVDASVVDASVVVVAASANFDLFKTGFFSIVIVVSQFFKPFNTFAAALPTENTDMLLLTLNR
ncbi:MAG: hypothetical protein ACK56I_22705, partial [bacterium]